MPDIQVTNHNHFPLPGRFNGKDYVFPPGVPVSVPEKAAEHIFALGRDDKTGALNRMGLLKPGGTLQEALKAYNSVSFAQGRLVFDEPEPLPPPDEPEVEQPIGDSPGAPPRNPGGESVVEAGEPVSAPDALAREVLARRRKRAESGG